eukprot:5406-Heterococcus_DN1.PRE.2
MLLGCALCTAQMLLCDTLHRAWYSACVSASIYYEVCTEFDGWLSHSTALSSSTCATIPWDSKQQQQQCTSSSSR